MPRLVRDAKYPPSSTIWRPFWALQWSPAKNRVVLQQGWDFLTVEVIEIRNKIHVPHSLNLLQWIVAWSIPEESTFRIPWVNNLFIYKAFCKFFCKIKRTCRTMLHSFMQNYAGPKNMCKKTRKTGGGQSSMGGYSASLMFIWTRGNWQNILMMFEWSNQVNKLKEMCRVHNILHSSKFWFDHKCCLSSLTSGYRIVFATKAECKPAPQGSVKT